MKEKNIFIFIRSVACFIFFVVSITSCSSSKKISTDFQYFKNGTDSVLAQQTETLIKPNDLLSIQVYSRTLNQEQAVIFNIPANNLQQGYQVSTAGTIDYPVIGSIQVAGMTRNQLQVQLTKLLASDVKNPSVLVRFIGFNVNVMGEVRSPGVKVFTADRVTIIDALSAANDLTDFGKRQDVMVIREERGKKIFYSIDLRSKAVFESPVYVLQPNDIVYVSPNKYKLNAIDVNPEVQRKTSLYLTLFSFAFSIVSFVIFITRT